MICDRVGDRTTINTAIHFHQYLYSSYCSEYSRKSHLHISIDTSNTADNAGSENLYCKKVTSTWCSGPQGVSTFRGLELL